MVICSEECLSHQSPGSNSANQCDACCGLLFWFLEGVVRWRVQLPCFLKDYLWLAAVKLCVASLCAWINADRIHTMLDRHIHTHTWMEKPALYCNSSLYGIRLGKLESFPRPGFQWVLLSSYFSGISQYPFHFVFSEQVILSVIFHILCFESHWEHAACIQTFTTGTRHPVILFRSTFYAGAYAMICFST